MPVNYNTLNSIFMNSSDRIVEIFREFLPDMPHNIFVHFGIFIVLRYPLEAAQQLRVAVPVLRVIGILQQEMHQ